MAPVLDMSLAGAMVVQVHRCAACGFRQVRPRLDPSVLPALYSGDYFDSAVPVGYADYARQSERRRREAFFLDRWLRRQTVQGPVLEVGCALGFLLAALRDAGHDVAGLDVSAFAAYYAHSRFGLPVRRATLEEAGYPDAAFACIVQKDVLEHVIDPRRHLRETHRVLRPGGWLWIVTPNGEANLRPLEVLARRTDPGASVPLMDQGHLSFFAADHLRRLFTECGFEIVGARSIGVRRGLRALGWLPGQARFQRLVPRHPPPPRPASETGAVSEEAFEALAGRIDAEVARRSSRARRSVPYYHLHRASKRLDELPGAWAVAYDFEFLLRRR